MKRFVDSVDRLQAVLFPERLDDYIDEDNPVRVIDAFVNELDLGNLGFDRVTPAPTPRRRNRKEDQESTRFALQQGYSIHAGAWQTANLITTRHF